MWRNEMGETTLEELRDKASAYLLDLKQFPSSRYISIAITKMEEVLHRLEDELNSKVE